MKGYLTYFVDYPCVDVQQLVAVQLWSSTWHFILKLTFTLGFTLNMRLASVGTVSFDEFYEIQESRASGSSYIVLSLTNCSILHSY